MEESTEDAREPTASPLHVSFASEDAAADPADHDIDNNSSPAAAIRQSGETIDPQEQEGDDPFRSSSLNMLLEDIREDGSPPSPKGHRRIVSLTPSVTAKNNEATCIRSQNISNSITEQEGAHGSVKRECTCQIVMPSLRHIRQQQSRSVTYDAQKPQYRLRTRTNGREADTNLLMDPTDNWWMTAWLTRYVRWSFQTSLTNLLLTLIAAFFFLILLWAILIFVVGRDQPGCIYVGGDYTFETGGEYFMDAFAISWTTFSTVGYGLTGPATSNSETQQKCFMINFFTSLEAFFGVLFAGFSAAMIYGRVQRVQSVARVLWSDPICIRYGTGVTVETKYSNLRFGDKDKDDCDEDDASRTKWPCPVLEFRIFNSTHDQLGGEIVNAQVTVWASTEVEMANKKIRKACNLPRLKDDFEGSLRGKSKGPKSPHDCTITKGLKSVAKNTMNFGTGAAKNTLGILAQRGKRISAASSTTYSERLSASSDVEAQVLTPAEQAAEIVEKERERLIKDVQRFAESKKHVALTEDPSDDALIPQMIYSKLDLETDSHPFFKRNWLIRHRLTATSPLLSNEAQQMIIENDGYWPAELNNHQMVRKHIHFHELMVTLTGTSNVSGSTVYSQKVYDFVDINVGYRFANALIQNPVTHKISVDLALLNDVTTQSGGGAEPFTDVLITDDGNTNVIEVAADFATDITLTGTTMAKGVTQRSKATALETEGPVSSALTKNASTSGAKRNRQDAISSSLVTREGGGEENDKDV